MPSLLEFDVHVDDRVSQRQGRKEVVEDLFSGAASFDTAGCHL